MNAQEANVLQKRFDNLDVTTYLKIDVTQGYSVCIADEVVFDFARGNTIADAAATAKFIFDERVYDLEAALGAQESLIDRLDSELDDVKRQQEKMSEALYKIGHLLLKG